jgi:hypothetical protein
MRTLIGLEHDVVILACAASAGVHGALVPHHLDEGVPTGLGFLVSAVLLGAVVVALTLRPESTAAVAAAAALLAGLLVAYAAAVTTGVPVLQPEPEPVDGLALATKAIEAVGLLAAWRLLRGHGFLTMTQHTKGIRA